MLRSFFALLIALLLVSSAASAPQPKLPAANPFNQNAQAFAMRPEYQADVNAFGWDRYSISARLAPESQTIDGAMRITWTNRDAVAVDQIALHLYPNHPDFGGRIDVTSARVNEAFVGSAVRFNDTLMLLEVPAPIAPAATATVELTFRSRTPRNASARTFGASNMEAGVWNMANFYPILARYTVGSGWDLREISSRGDFTVSDTALYEVTIDAPSDWELATTGARLGEPSLNAGRRVERFVSGPQREFFVAALNGLERASTEVDGTRVVAHYQRGNSAAGQRALAAAADSVRAFNRAFGDYPFAEIEVVQAALTTFLGMEYPGIVLIEQNLYFRNTSSLATTVAHEVAHQWWYSIVGNDPQRDPWLDEGMASFSQLVYYEAIGDLVNQRRELDQLRNLYRSARVNGRDAPLSSPPTALRGNYVQIIYGKGGLFFERLRRDLGPEAFGTFVKEYYRSQRYGEGTGEEILAAAEGACGCELDSLYNDWVLSARAVNVP